MAPLDRVLAFPAPVGEERLDVDGGAMGAWHRIRKLATMASLLHVTAHPDDEHAGMLTLASRGWGVRTEPSDRRPTNVFAIVYGNISAVVYSFVHNFGLD